MAEEFVPEVCITQMVTQDGVTYSCGSMERGGHPSRCCVLRSNLRIREITHFIYCLSSNESISPSASTQLHTGIPTRAPLPYHLGKLPLLASRRTELPCLSNQTNDKHEQDIKAGFQIRGWEISRRSQFVISVDGRENQSFPSHAITNFLRQKWRVLTLEVAQNLLVRFTFSCIHPPTLPRTMPDDG